MRKRKIYLGKRHHHKPLPRILKYSTLEQYGQKVVEYFEGITTGRIAFMARSCGKSKLIDHFLTPYVELVRLERGLTTPTIGLLKAKMPVNPYLIKS